MTLGITQTLLSERTIPGVTIQMVDNHWDAGAEILDHTPEVLLRWRLRPYRIKARGWITPGEMSSFGQLMLYPAGVATHARAGDEDEDVRLLLCRFDRAWLDAVLGSKHDWSSTDPQTCLDLRNPNIDHAMRRLAIELSEPGLGSAALSEALGMSIAVDLARYFRSPAESAHAERGLLSSRRLKQIRDFVFSFSVGSPTLADVAQEVGVSEPHLRRVFKNSTGQTLHDFIEEVRVSRAQMLLTETNLPLKVISYRLGFCHPSAFSFAFKKATGEAPRDFRRRRGNGAVLLS